VGDKSEYEGGRGIVQSLFKGDDFPYTDVAVVELG
jgi:uncharacterized protein with PIN domain